MPSATGMENTIVGPIIDPELTQSIATLLRHRPPALWREEAAHIARQQCSGEH